MRVQEIIDSAGFQISVTKVAMVCVAAVSLLSLVATTHITPCAGKLLILPKKSKYF